MLSTQSDKTLDALGVLDSLIREMPLKPERMEAVKQTLVNRINNDYPPFRNLSEKVASARMEGFDRDPAEEFLRDIATMDMQDISRFYREQISGRPVVYVIAGNRKHIEDVYKRPEHLRIGRCHAFVRLVVGKQRDLLAERVEHVRSTELDGIEVEKNGLHHTAASRFDHARCV